MRSGCTQRGAPGCSGITIQRTRGDTSYRANLFLNANFPASYQATPAAPVSRRGGNVKKPRFYFYVWVNFFGSLT